MKIIYNFVDKEGNRLSMLPYWDTFSIYRMIDVTRYPSTGDPDDPDDQEELVFTVEVGDVLPD